MRTLKRDPNKTSYEIRGRNSSIAGLLEKTAALSPAVTDRTSNRTAGLRGDCGSVTGHKLSRAVYRTALVRLPPEIEAAG